MSSNNTLLSPLTFCPQWRTTVTPVTPATRKPTWRVRPVRTTITTVLSLMPRASVWPLGLTALRPTRDKPACTPAHHKAPSRFPPWRTSAATPGPACPRTGLVPSPPCSQWRGCPTSTSPLTSPQGLWSPDSVGWGATPHHSWVTAITQPCTRTQWAIRAWADSAARERGSSRRQAAYRETSTSTRTVSHAHYHRTSTTPCTVLASCRSGMRTARPLTIILIQMKLEKVTELNF